MYRCAGLEWFPVPLNETEQGRTTDNWIGHVFRGFADLAVFVQFILQTSSIVTDLYGPGKARLLVRNLESSHVVLVR